ncbi:MAG: DUF5677 domain-containing protein, partial [Sphingomonadaceae bacterium]
LTPCPKNRHHLTMRQLASRAGKCGDQQVSFQKAIMSFTDQAPQMVLEQLLRKKLKEAGVQAWRNGAKALAQHIISKEAGEFHWEDYPVEEDKHIRIEFTKDDGVELERIFDKFQGGLDDAVSKMAEAAVDKMLARYRKDWHQYRRAEDRYIGTFRNNLEDRWGEALDGLRLLLDLCRDEGEKFYRRLEKSKAKATPYARILLSRLHCRACQVTSEIITLLENGYARGAMARWRTLHEIEVVATFISEAGNSAAKRYFDYEIVEAKRAKDQYQENYEELGYEPFDPDKAASIEEDFARILSQYGSEFRNPYGWASEFLGNKSPRFADIERVAGAARMRSHYKFASYNVHASPKSLSLRMDTFSEGTWPIAGASNAGLEEPGQNAALTILRVTYLLTKNLTSLDNSIIMNALINLRDDTIEAFGNCARQLADDDADIRSAVEEFDIEVDTTLI